MKQLAVHTFGRMVVFLHKKFRNLRALYFKSKIHAGTNFELIDPKYIDLHSKFEVGNSVFINSNLTALVYERIYIGHEVMFGPNVTLLTSGHNPDLSGLASRNSHLYGPITICDKVWIGANVIILPNVQIGRNSVIGAGSVVTKSIPENVIAAGNPCRVIRKKISHSS